MMLMYLRTLLSVVIVTDIVNMVNGFPLGCRLQTNSMLRKTSLKCVGLSLTSFPGSLGSPHYLYVSGDSVTRNNIPILAKNDFLGASALEVLGVSWSQVNGIENEAFSGLHQLRTLTLSNNNLRRLTADTFKGLPVLSVLDISGNRDCEIDARMFTYIVSIQELNLGDMNIRKVDKDMFKNLTRLRVLKLHMNNLEKIHENVILNLPSLETLDLNGNLLRGIPSELQPKFQAMNQVHFSENPLQCNCQLLWIRSLSERFYDSSSVVCYGPSKLRYSAFVNVPDSEFICIPSKIVSCKAPHVKIGQRLTIECEYEGDPIPEIKWQRPGGPPIDGREFNDGQYQITENGTLIITSVADIDVGDWTVTAYNKTVSAEYRVSLYVDKTTTPPSTPAYMSRFITSALTELPTSITSTNVQEASNIMSKLKWGLVATGAVAVAGGVAVLIKCYKKKLVSNSKVGVNL